MSKEVLLNDFAIRSFRDIVDYDYMAARTTYRAKLIPQFLWSAIQAIEKYVKFTSPQAFLKDPSETVE